MSSSSAAEQPRGNRHVEPMVRPPTLRTEGARGATPLELFFDLAYVLVVAELTTALVHDLSWTGVATFAGLFTVVWFSWVEFTLYANRFDTDDVVLRVAKLVATLAIAGCAASATEAVGSTATAFAASYLVGRVVLVVLYLRAWRHVDDARATVVVYLATVTGVAALWAASLAVPAPWRYGVWALAVAVDASGPLLATARGGGVGLHMEHLPERFGLLVILVLGEMVAATVTGVHEVHWAAPSVVLAAVGFALTASLWWNYFDVGATTSGQRLAAASPDDHDGPDGGDLEPDADEDDAADVDERHDLFVYGHLPLTMGIAAAGAGLEELVLHPDDPLPSPAGWLLCAGLAVFFVGAAVVVGGALRRLRSIAVWPVAAVPAVLAVGVLAPSRPLVLMAALAVIGVVMAVVGTTLTRRPSRSAQAL